MKRDTFVLGVLAGFAGNIPKVLLAWIFHFLGYLRYTFEQIAAGVFVSLEHLDNPVSLITGAIADWVMAGILGIIILLLIEKSGYDYPIFKATITSLGIYILFYGALMSMNVTRVTLATPLPNLLLIFPHLLFGVTVGYVIRRNTRDLVR